MTIALSQSATSILLLRYGKMAAKFMNENGGGNVSSYYFYNRDHRPPTRLTMTAGKNQSDRVLCSVSRASAGLTTEYMIVSSKPPTGYYVDGVTACSVSRASAGFTEYLIVSNLEPLPLEIVCHHPILETHLVIHAHQTTIPRSYT